MLWPCLSLASPLSSGNAASPSTTPADTRTAGPQFESHRTVNPNDVENAAWHFLCVARSESPEAARSALLPVGPDRRIPMGEIYEMFRGDLSPAEVLRAGGDVPLAQFYAYLYAGLYLEALGDAEGGLSYMRTAAEDRFRGGGYMHTVARIHAGLIERRE